MDDMKTKFRETSGWLVYNRKFDSGAVPNTGILSCDVLRSSVW